MANSRSIDARTHETAVRLAVQCRRIVQACLREEEWLDADQEFYSVIFEGLQEYRIIEATRDTSGDQGQNTANKP